MTDIKDLIQADRDQDAVAIHLVNADGFEDFAKGLSAAQRASLAGQKFEGRGYQADGTLDFNAFAVVSCFEPGEACEMRSYNDGRAGTFALEPTGDGFVWTIPAGPSARIVYTATLEGDTWTEVGQYHPGGSDPVEIFRMELTRTGDTDWPAGGAVMPD